MITSIVLIASVGLLISAYAFFIEQKIKQYPNYKPFCDISENISCTKRIKSSSRQLFRMSDSITGMLFYAFIIFLTWTNYVTLIFYAALAAGFISLYLAYILFTEIKSFCLLCVSIYVINILLIITSWNV